MPGVEEAQEKAALLSPAGAGAGGARRPLGRVAPAPPPRRLRWKFISQAAGGLVNFVLNSKDKSNSHLNGYFFPDPSAKKRK